MALLLSLRWGDSFYAGQEKVIVTNIRQWNDFDIATETGTHQITDEDWTDFLPGVAGMSSYNRPEDFRLVRLMIHAPGVPITRTKPEKESSDDRS